jgi:hypothetical protein
MSTVFDLFAVGPEVASLEDLVLDVQYDDRFDVPTFGRLERVRANLSTLSSTLHATGAVVEHEQCRWTLDLTFSFEGDEVASITVHVVPRVDAADRPMSLATLVAKVAATLGGSAFHRESGGRVIPSEERV